MANRYPLIVDSSSQQIKELPSGDTLVIDNLQVTGTTTSIETATLNVEDKNITINYSSGDSSSTADGSGLTFQDAVDASTDATILWNQSNSRFDFSHGIDVSPSASDAVFLRSSNATTTNVYITNTNATANNTANLYFAPANNVAGAQISSIAIEDFSVSANRTADLAFYTRKDGTMSEKMRVNSSGALSVEKSAYIKQVALTSSSNSVAWDAQAAANAYHLLTENTTFAAPSNAVEGAIISVEIAQGGTPYTVAWNTVFEFAASTAPTMTATANKTDIFSFRYNGSVWQEIGRVQNMDQT
jgi:hypothetical protein